MSQDLSLEQAIKYLNQKEYKLAEAKLRQAFDFHTNCNTEIKFRLAFCLEMQGKYKEAESVYLQVSTSYGPLEIKGDSLFRIAWMAMTLKKDHIKAIEYFKKAAEVLIQSPDSQKLYKDSVYWMALSHEVLDRIIDALDIYEQIAMDDFWFWDVCHRKIICLDKIGLYEEALACCKEFEDHYRTVGGTERAINLYPTIKSIKDQLEKLSLDSE